GATIIPLICRSHETQLSDFSGDRSAWPIYLTIGNIHSPIRNKYSYIAHMILAFLHVPPKFREISRFDNRIQRDINQQVLSEIAKIVLDPLRQFPKRGDIDTGAV
ncbi:hypothetical protein BDD12DRAFT_752851, partial [Trichophaea hybrida]